MAYVNQVLVIVADPEGDVLERWSLKFSWILALLLLHTESFAA